MIKILKGIEILLISAAILFFPACSKDGADSPSYPQEAYDNPVGEAIASAAYVEEYGSGNTLAAGVDAGGALVSYGIEETDEDVLCALLGDDAFVHSGCTYYYKMRTYENGGGEVCSPVVYVIPDGSASLCGSVTAHYVEGSSDIYYNCYGYCCLAYQYIQDGGYKLVTKSDMLMVCVFKYANTFSYQDGKSLKTETTAFWQYEIAPYFDDAVTSYLNGADIPADVCINEIALTDSGREICKFYMQV